MRHPAAGLKAILASVSRQIEPSLSERHRAKRTFADIKGRILRRAAQLALKARVVEVGSVGKDTWLRGEADLDIFIVFSPSIRLEDVKNCGLKLGKYASRGKYVTAYAEHPYVRTRLNGFEIDIVPCVGVRNPSHIVTAVDRTPFHKRFVIERLNRDLRRDARLLKRFLMTLGIYGANIKVQGFSGYLAELLVIQYGGFLETLRATADWFEGIFIDPSRFYENPEDVHVVFGNDPLIVIDPVDRRRNVASAVTRTNLAVFVAAARNFLRGPDHRYFASRQRPPATGNLQRSIKRLNTPLLGMQVQCPKLVPDVLWGQLHKSCDGLKTLLEHYDFKVIYCGVWSSVDSSAVFLFELEALELPPTLTHWGPSVYMKSETEDFLEKHLASDRTVAGPWIEENRWVVQILRENISAVDIFERKLGEARLGVEIEKTAKRKKRIAVREGVIKLASHENDYLIFLERFLKRRPGWLEWRSKDPQKTT